MEIELLERTHHPFEFGRAPEQCAAPPERDGSFLTQHATMSTGRIKQAVGDGVSAQLKSFLDVSEADFKLWKDSTHLPSTVTKGALASALQAVPEQDLLR